MTLPSYQCTLREDRTSQCVAQSCNLAHDTVTRLAARPFFSVPSLSSASMSSMTPDRLVRSVLSAVNPGLSVQDLELVPSASLQLLYNVNVSEGPSLLLALSPPAMMRQLRSEKSPIGSEAAILKWLSGLQTIASSPRTKTSSRDMLPVNNNTKTISREQPLSRYLPILVRHESMGSGLTFEYNLSRPPRGVSISSLSRPLTTKERRVVDFQTGQLLHCISSQFSPTRRFGMAADVLSVPVPASQVRRLEGSLQASRGADRWSVAFRSLLESILRDGEDLAVMINYGTIRRHFDRFEHLLDAVTKPRLVVVDAGEDVNTLVFRSSETRKKATSLTEQVKKQRDHKPKKEPSIRSEVKPTPAQHDNHAEAETDGGAPEDTSQSKGHIEVSGLRQWTNCLFGDPLMATVFSKHPSRDFWNGFDQALPGEKGTGNESSAVVEDEPNAHIRLLLYECYHAVVAVVREFYRPHKDSSMRELAARKQLGNVLARLDDSVDDATPRRRRPSGEVSPAKRPRSGGVDD